MQCHENAPSQAKEPSKGVSGTKYAYESLSMDHFYLKGIEYLAIVNGHSGMLSVHCTAFKGSKELVRILRLHCQKNGIPREVCTDGSKIFCSHETKDFFRRFNIIHRVSSVANAHSNLRSDLSVTFEARPKRYSGGNRKLGLGCGHASFTEPSKYSL